MNRNWFQMAPSELRSISCRVFEEGCQAQNLNSMATLLLANQSECLVGRRRTDSTSLFSNKTTPATGFQIKKKGMLRDTTHKIDIV